MKTILTVTNDFTGHFNFKGEYERKINPPKNELELLDLINSIDVDHFNTYNKGGAIQFDIVTIKDSKNSYHIGSGFISKTSICAHCSLPNWWRLKVEDRKIIGGIDLNLQK